MKAVVVILAFAMTVSFALGYFAKEAESGAKPIAGLKAAISGGKSIADYSKGVTAEELKKTLSEVLSGQDPHVRCRVLEFIIGKDKKEIRTYRKHIEALGRAIVGDKIKTLPEWEGEEVELIARVLAKSCEKGSVPVLLDLAGDTEMLLARGKPVVSTDGRRLPMWQGKSVFPAVADAIRKCSGGKIGTIPEGVRWERRVEEKDSFVAKWTKAWDEELKKEKAGAGAKKGTEKK
jgi:hypothetical protein